MAKHFIADKETLDKVYDILKAEEVYGFIEHFSETNPAKRIEYIGKNKDYVPITQDLSNSTVNYGSWESFPVLVNNKPWMVKENGVPDYRLKEDDYTKKLDGTLSGVEDSSYPGGAFAWLQKVYSRQEILGNDRYVYFSMVKRDGFEAVGFREWNSESNTYDEVEGIWIPMFYGTAAQQDVVSIFSTKKGNTENNKWITSIAGTMHVMKQDNVSLKSVVRGIELWKDEMTMKGYRLFEGSIINIINDLLIMFAKTSDLKSVFGKGAQDRNVSEMLKNEVIGGGQFKGTDEGRSLNKIFHSIVLGSYQQGQVDTRMFIVGDTLRILSDQYTTTKYPLADDKQRLLTDLGENVLTRKMWKRILGYHLITGYGLVPAAFSEGDDIGGGYIRTGASSSVLVRFGSNTEENLKKDKRTGLRVLDFYPIELTTSMDGYIGAGVGVSPMLMPPVELIP